MKRFLIFACMLLSGSVLFADCIGTRGTDGDLYFRVGPSNEAVRPRGDGRHKHWEMGADLCLSGRRFEFEGTANFAGAATFDNMDSADIGLRFSARIVRSFFVEAVHSDAYALNQNPIPDPTARRPNSSVNFWGVGPRWDAVRREKVFLSLHARYIPAGDLPAWNEYYTAPYAKETAGFDFRMAGPRHSTIVARSDFYLDGASRGYNAVSIAIEHPIAKHIVGEIRGNFYGNFGVPPGMKMFSGCPLGNTRGLFAGIKYRFGN